MPVTARLSKGFYTNDLVDWFNAVDMTYKADLRELNDLNFVRFDSRLEQRVATLEARVESRFAAFEAKVEGSLAALEAKMDEQTRWLVASWVTVLAAVIGLWLRG